MLWFKKRLSTLFGGGGKRTSKRDEGSKGRIHTAIVSRFHEDTRSVTVEWYERGESKGKEIEIDMLLELNKKMELQPQQHHQQRHQQHPQHETKRTAEDVEMQTETPAPANLARKKQAEKSARCLLRILMRTCGASGTPTQTQLV
uniref:Kinesin-like protein KIF2A-like N-terminal domain-containing protein n=1 Tax=Anopheles christyi TaxID=43041 RepID=A0A182K8D6_9DIPT